MTETHHQTAPPIHVLLVDDDEDELWLVEDALLEAGFSPHIRRVETEAGMREALARQAWDILVVDYRMPRFSAPAALALYRELRLETPFIVFSGQMGEEHAVEMMRQGAHDYVTKQNRERLLPAIVRELQDYGERRERKRLEKELKHTAKEWTLAMDLFDDAIYLLDRERCLLRANQAFYTLIGSDAESAAGRYIADLVHPRGEDQLCPVCQAQEAGRDAVIVMEAEDPANYSGQPLEITLKMVPGEDDQPAGMLVSIHDLSNARRIEAALSESEARYRTLFEESPIALWEQDLSATKALLEQRRDEGVVDFGAYFDRYPEILEQCRDRIKILAVNHSTLDLFGAQSAAELLARYADIFSGEGLIALRGMLQEFLAGKTFFEREIRMLRLDKCEVWPRLTLSIVPGHEQNWGRVVMSMLDLTERCYMEDALRYAKTQADTANRAKSAFLANMSHELRTPLNGIMGFAQLLYFDESLTDEQRRQARTIERSGQHLLTLLNDVLDFSKIEAGKLELHYAEMSMPGFFGDLESLFRLRARQKGLDFHYECQRASVAHPFPSVVEADEKRLRQILLNLLSNAVKYTVKGSVSLRVQYADGALHMAVEDSGRGIAAGDLQTVFEPFRQVGDQHNIEGTGLGLPICRKLVDLMDGQLTVTSRLGQGTCFTCVVPLPVRLWEKVPGQAPAPTAPAPEERRPRGFLGLPRKVLIVDDMVDARALLRIMLTPLGFILAEAQDGAEALRKAERFSPDIVLMDLRMPVMDGFECIRRLRAQERFAALPIIAVSASVFDEDRKAAAQAGCTAFLNKPLSFKQLQDALAEHCGIQWQNTATEAAAGVPQTRPPPEQLSGFLKLMDMGDIALLQARLDDFCQNPAWADFCGHAGELLDSFRLQELRQLLKPTDPQG